MYPEDHNACSMALTDAEIEAVTPRANVVHGPDSKRKRLFAMLLPVALFSIPALCLEQQGSSTRPVERDKPAQQTSGADIPTLEAAVKASPTVAARLSLAAAYINGRQTSRAVPLLDAVLAAEPNNVMALNNYCVVHVQQQDFPAAVAACSKAISIDPKFQLAQNNLGWAFSEMQKARAELAQDEKVPVASRSQDVNLRDGLDYLHLGEYDQAIAAFGAMLKSNPQSSTAANNIGTAYMMKHQYAQATDWFKKAIVFDPRSEIARNNLGWAAREIAKEHR